MNTNKLTIGLDLGDRRHHVCVLSASGDILAEEVIPNDLPPELVRFSGINPGG